MTSNEEKQRLRWKAKIQNCLDSGLSFRAWCRLNHVSWTRISYWKNELFPDFTKNVKDTVTSQFPCKNLFLFSRPIDMRNHFNYLSSLVLNKHEQSLRAGALFAFLNRPRNTIKVLYWAENGHIIWSKRLERGVIKVEIPNFKSTDEGQFIQLI